MKNPNSPFCYKLFVEGTFEEKCSENDDGILNSMVGFYTDDEIIGFTTLLSNGRVCISHHLGMNYYDNFLERWGSNGFQLI